MVLYTLNFQLLLPLPHSAMGARNRSSVSFPTLYVTVLGQARRCHDWKERLLFSHPTELPGICFDYSCRIKWWRNTWQACATEKGVLKWTFCFCPAQVYFKVQQGLLQIPFATKGPTVSWNLKRERNLPHSTLLASVFWRSSALSLKNKLYKRTSCHGKMGLFALWEIFIYIYRKYCAGDVWEKSLYRQESVDGLLQGGAAGQGSFWLSGGEEPDVLISIQLHGLYGLLHGL